MAMVPSVIKVGATLTIHMHGKMYTIDKTIRNYDLILEIVKDKRWDELQDQLDIALMVAKKSNGKAEIINDKVFLGGVEMSNTLATRIIEMLREGWDVDPMLKFLENVAANPADYAIKELYLFLETNNLPITEDGCFLAYKVVDHDYMDKHTRTIRNRIGDKPFMLRKDVDPNRNNECSRGLHFCSRSYISSFGNSKDRLMLVKVNPADVVSIPRDYQNTKGRTWRYEVVDEIPFGAKDQVDASAPAVIAKEALRDEHVATSTETKVLQVIAEQLAKDVSSLHMGTKLEDLSIDSLDEIEIIMALEEAFDIETNELTDSDRTNLKTIGDVIRKVDEFRGTEIPVEEDEGEEDADEAEELPVVIPVKKTAAPKADRFTKFLATKDLSGSDLKNFREDLNITGSALAAELGVSRSAVWSFENSLKPKPETIVRAVNALKSIYQADKK